MTSVVSNFVNCDRDRSMRVAALAALAVAVVALLLGSTQALRTGTATTTGSTLWTALIWGLLAGVVGYLASSAWCVVNQTGGVVVPSLKPAQSLPRRPTPRTTGATQAGGWRSMYAGRSASRYY